ncbi:E3 ubiquitin-protein ligase TRIM56 [Holothuria leucospilota]|uniref:E3 ubiquitin-protein ligase TRIM56 n=1 Tax=Holothuria leucospilota TaxID=206669 RepID=A0A9Q0YIB5_HOLLE|nr:E3 ubiquitin-protein ligase TRIM56 [Holothuria leucospilota]
MAGNVLQSLSEDFLHCHICREPYNVPKMLPCLHSFCLQCLERWARTFYAQQLSCPTCRCNVDLPSTGVSGLPGNFFLVSLMERLEEASRLFMQHQDCNCQICKNIMGTMFCLDCKMHICHECKETHDLLTKSSDHPLIPSEKLSDKNYVQRVLSSQTPQCNVHKQEKVRYFCTQCSHLACQVCAIVSHQGHQSLQEVETAVTSAKAELETLLEDVKSNKQDARNNLKVTREATEEIECHFLDLHQKVDSRYNEIVIKLNSDKEKLKAELRRFQDEQCASIKTIEKNISDWLNTVESTQELTGTIIQSNSWDILEMKSKLVYSLNKLNQVDKEKMFMLQRNPFKVKIPPMPVMYQSNLEKRASHPLASRKKFDFYPANLNVVNTIEKRKSLIGGISIDANFIGRILSLGFLPSKWLF